MLFRDLVVYSPYRDELVRGISLMFKRSLGARVDLVHVDVGLVDRGKYCSEG